MKKAESDDAIVLTGQSLEMLTACAATQLKRVILGIAAMANLSISDTNVPSWIELCQRAGLRPIGVTEDQSMTAFTIEHADMGWVAYFNRAAPIYRQCRFLCHEACEYLLAAGESDCPYLPHVRALNVCIGDWRHEVANVVVRALFAS